MGQKQSIFLINLIRSYQ